MPSKSRVSKLLYPESEWGWIEVLLNKIAYNTEMTAWLQSKDASEKYPKNRPTPYYPPFIKAALKPSRDPDIASYTIDSLKELLSKPRVVQSDHGKQ